MLSFNLSVATNEIRNLANKVMQKEQECNELKDKLKSMEKLIEHINGGWLEWYTRDLGEETQDPLEVLIELRAQSNYNVYLKEYLENILNSEKRIFITSSPDVGYRYNTTEKYPLKTPNRD
jgi:chromosome segregation ATPase